MYLSRKIVRIRNSRREDFVSHLDPWSPCGQCPPPHPSFAFSQLQLVLQRPSRSSGWTNSVFCFFYHCDYCKEFVYMGMKTFSYYLLVILALPFEMREKQSSPTLMRRPFASFSTITFSFALLSRHNITGFQNGWWHRLKFFNILATSYKSSLLNPSCCDSLEDS